MIKILFIVSDVHGHYKELMDALDRAGFREKDESHVFVSCGDLFDRGRENRSVYDFVKGLKHKILIKGNHEDMLAETLRRGYITEREIWNGTDITVSEMLGEGAIDAKGTFDTVRFAAEIKELIDFTEQMADYYETGEYVLTHGWLPIVFKERYPRVDLRWRSASKEAWEEARCLEWQQLYNVGAVLEGKTIVCGHRPARLGSMFDCLREPDCSEPFYGKGMTAIDAGTVRSGRINVLVVPMHGDITKTELGGFHDETGSSCVLP